MKNHLLIVLALLCVIYLSSCEKSESDSQVTTDFLENNFVGIWSLDSSQYEFEWINHSGMSVQWEHFEEQSYDGNYLVDKYNFTSYQKYTSADTNYWYIDNDSIHYDSSLFSLEINFLGNGYIEIFETYNGEKLRRIANEKWQYSEREYSEGVEKKKEIVVSFSLNFTSRLKFLSETWNKEQILVYQVVQDEISTKRLMLQNDDSDCSSSFYFSKN